METRELKNLGIAPSLLGFGCMRFPTLENGKIDEAEAEKMLDLAMAQGVTYYDTAVPYHGGDSEPFVGRALAKYPRESYFLATKLPSWDVKERADVRRIFDVQLKKLQTDYIDFYLLHALDRGRWEKLRDLGVLEECDALRREGKIKYFGFSFHDSFEVFSEIISYRKWDFCQLQVNYMDQNEQAGLKGLALAESLNVPVVVMEPIKGGQLARLPESVRKPLTDLNSALSDSAWAMRWVASQPNIAVILSGMSTMEQVEDNLKTFSDFHPLGEAEFAAIEAVADALRARVKNGCTGCAYCMPCPAGVDIPKNFSIWNSYGMYENETTAKRAIQMGLPEEARAKNCILCGKCEAVCPQGIAIREDLKQVTRDLEEYNRKKQEK